MKYSIDWIIAALLAVGTFLWILQEPKAFHLSNLQLRSLDNYPINHPKKTFILHLSTFNCQSCKRDTQILMRYYIQHPDIPIIDANIVQKESQVEEINQWQKKLDVGYTVAILQDSSSISNRIPSTFVIDPSSNQITELFGRLTYEKLLEATNKEK